MTEAVVSSNYLAFLLEDGRVCRVSYAVLSDKIADVATTSTQLNTSSSDSSKR